MNTKRPKRQTRIPGLLCVSAVLWVLSPATLWGQLSAPPITSTYESAQVVRIQELVDAALLTESDELRDSNLNAAEVFARSLVEQEPESAEATYWLAVVLGIRTENTGGLGKLSLGREVFALSARVVALDSLYAGGLLILAGGRLFVDSHIP